MKGEFGPRCSLNNGLSHPLWKPVKLGLPLILSWVEVRALACNDESLDVESTWPWGRQLSSDCVVIRNIHRNILIFFSWSYDSILPPHVLWVKYDHIICFGQWNVSRSYVGHFWVETFNNLRVILQCSADWWHPRSIQTLPAACLNGDNVGQCIQPSCDQCEVWAKMNTVCFKSLTYVYFLSLQQKNLGIPTDTISWLQSSLLPS